MKNQKKAQINQIFIYLVSIIVVVFAGYLVTSFVITFTSDTEQREYQEAINEMERDYDVIRADMGSEIVRTYNFPNFVTTICFITDEDCISDLDEIDDIGEVDNTLAAFEGGDSITFYDDTSFLRSEDLDYEYHTEDDCFCSDLTDTGNIELILRNDRNDIYIEPIN